MLVRYKNSSFFFGILFNILVQMYLLPGFIECQDKYLLSRKNKIFIKISFSSSSEKMNIISCLTDFLTKNYIQVISVFFNIRRAFKPAMTCLENILVIKGTKTVENKNVQNEFKFLFFRYNCHWILIFCVSICKVMNVQ